MLSLALMLLSLSTALAGEPLVAGDRKVLPSGYAMRAIPEGTYTTEGCQDGDCLYSTSLNPVRLERPLLVGEVEVTRGLYRQVMGGAPTAYDCGHKDCPAVMLSWEDAASFANALSKADGLVECYFPKEIEKSWKPIEGCSGYRIPSEREWEIAAYGGTSAPYSGSYDPNVVGWHKSNSKEQIRKGGQKQPNGFGLYDMSGNVLEWVWLPSAAMEGVALKGGCSSWEPTPISHTEPQTDRKKRYSNVGLRLIRTDVQSYQASVDKLEKEKAALEESENLAKDLFLEEFPPETAPAEPLAPKPSFGATIWWAIFSWMVGFPTALRLTRVARGNAWGPGEAVGTFVFWLGAPFWLLPLSFFEAFCERRAADDDVAPEDLTPNE